jgi:hypothetical protein
MWTMGACESNTSSDREKGAEIAKRIKTQAHAQRTYVRRRNAARIAPATAVRGTSPRLNQPL